MNDDWNMLKHKGNPSMMEADSQKSWWINALLTTIDDGITCIEINIPGHRIEIVILSMK